MVKEYIPLKLPDSDPRQCEVADCLMISVEGSARCMIHGGYFAAVAAEKLRMRNYRLSKFHSRANELADNPEITSLRDEVGLLRLLIEERIEHCKDTTDLLLVSGPLSDLLMKVEKLVSSMQKLEEKMGQQLDKNKVIQLAQALLDIIGKYIDNSTVLDAIGEDFYKALENV